MAAAPAAAPPQYLFQVISDEIKQLILDLKYTDAQNRAQGEVNQNVAAAVQRLQRIEQNIGMAIGAINAGNNNVHITDVDANGTRTAARNNYGLNIQTQGVRDFFNAARYTDDGRLAANNGTNISIDNIDEPILTRGNLQTDYNNQPQLYMNNPADVDILENRLRNCQYLEILYLTKHDELMKLFAFTLTVFNKYKYAIRILLFVLKNLLDAPPQPPLVQPPQGHVCPPCPQIRLPRALIPNIKSLIRDQKQVQDVILRMQNTLNADHLATQQNSQRVDTPLAGHINDPNAPP